MTEHGYTWLDMLAQARLGLILLEMSGLLWLWVSGLAQLADWPWLAINWHGWPV